MRSCSALSDVRPLFGYGERAHVYVFQWSSNDAAGWAAPEASLTLRERQESLSHIFARNPVLGVTGTRPGGELRRINRSGDIFCACPAGAARCRVHAYISQNLGEIDSHHSQAPKTSLERMM
jgi:hypothetical protein